MLRALVQRALPRCQGCGGVARIRLGGHQRVRSPPSTAATQAAAGAGAQTDLAAAAPWQAQSRPSLYAGVCTSSGRAFSSGARQPVGIASGRTRRRAPRAAAAPAAAASPAADAAGAEGASQGSVGSPPAAAEEEWEADDAGESGWEEEHAGADGGEAFPTLQLELPPPTNVRVRTAEFVKSSVEVAQCPREGPPEFAVIGRSNVGKSSLINMLTGRKSLAQVSKEPGA